MKRELFIAIIGDLVKSRDLQYRKDVQSKLLDVVKEINLEFKDSIASKFVITIGDEFQGLVIKNFNLQKFLWTFNTSFGNQFKTRFGIGFGPLDTGLNKEALGMDGPCFHNARSAITLAQRNSDSLLFKGFEADDALDVLYSIIHNIESNWTSSQREIMLLLNGGYSPQEIAKKIGVTKQTVSRHISTAKYEHYKDGWKGINQLITNPF